MNAAIAKLIGGAGTGKTTELMRILSEVVGRGVDPYEIGFVSFTRAARAEAAQRVAAEFGVEAEQLQRVGWFRTLHSVCYQALGHSKKYKLITDSKESRLWLEEAVGEPVVGKAVSVDGDLPDVSADDGQQSMAAVALNLWSVARNKLISLREEFELAQATGDDLGSLEYCEHIVRKYEEAKYIDDRVDFADLAGKVAGWKWHVLEEPTPTSEEGDLPALPVWVFDEHQDVSQLLHSVALRLVSQPSCKWAYFAGDPFQALYGFSGADNRCLLEGVDADKVRMMQQSYRCPAGVLQLGEQALRRCSDYFDRKIKPNCTEHGVDATYQFASMLTQVDPSKESWLFLARTNLLAKRFYKKLEQENIPWDYTRGEGGYLTPTIRMACSGMTNLQDGLVVEADQWKAIVKSISAGSGEQRWLTRGAKSQLAASKLIIPEALHIEETLHCGATRLLADAIVEGTWPSLIKGAERFINADRRHGRLAALRPSIRVGTIHSVKGSEADNVVMLSSLTRRCEVGRRTRSGFDAEQRVSYVGITRARKRLVVLSQRRDRWRMDLG